MLAKWLPASANGYLSLVPGVTGAMLVSPGVEFEAEVSLGILSLFHPSLSFPSVSLFLAPAARVLSSMWPLPTADHI